MSLEHLWAGWRSSYVTGDLPVGSGPHGAARGTPDGAGVDSCVFCAIAASPEGDTSNFVLWRGEHVLAVLNAFPYAPGHLMVMPLRHVGELEQLGAEESGQLWSGTQLAVRALKGAMAPDGLNLGVNLGRAAGAGIPAHLHVHVVPRWLGDTNFMTSVASARVLPEALGDTYAKLRAAWPS